MKKFFTKIKNILRWIPLLWKDEEWDYSFMLDIERKKLTNMIKWYEDNDMGHCESGHRTHRQMCLAKSCLDIILDQDWWTFKDTYDENDTMSWFGLLPQNQDKYCVITPYVNRQNWKVYMPKLPEKQFNRITNVYTVDLRIEKAWALYNKLRDKYMRDWWD